jgi:hypothetical protein
LGGVVERTGRSLSQMIPPKQFIHAEGIACAC